jgi:hypothetical protein
LRSTAAQIEGDGNAPLTEAGIEHALDTEHLMSLIVPISRGDSSDAMPPEFVFWHPKLQRMYRYWRQIHPTKGLPGRQHFDPLDVADLLPGVWLLDVQRAPFRLRYRLAGTRIIAAIGHEVTGGWVDEVHPQLVNDDTYFGRYRSVVETGTPSHRRGTSRTGLQEDFRDLENLALPLAADGETVDMMVVLTVFHYPQGSPD